MPKQKYLNRNSLICFNAIDIWNNQGFQDWQIEGILEKTNKMPLALSQVTSEDEWRNSVRKTKWLSQNQFYPLGLV